MNKVFSFLALVIGLVCSATAQVNESRYITLNVINGEELRFDFKAATPNTQVRIKNGSLNTTITVGTEWKGSTQYIAADNIMTIYGDITGFDCSENEDAVTAIDVRNNTELAVLRCYNNSLTTLDVSKNTKLTELDCSLNKLKVLNVSKNTQLKLLACSFNEFTSPLDITNNRQLTSLQCYYNNLTALDVSKNRQLTKLVCYHNNLTALDVSNNRQLIGLYCSTNNIATLDVSKNTKLMYLQFYQNNLTSIDVSKNTLLTELWCYQNKIDMLDVSKNTQLTDLICSNNQLKYLDVSNNRQLKRLWCWSNRFSTEALDDIFCALPYRKPSDDANIQPVFSVSSKEEAEVLARTNAKQAIDKNWKVQYAAMLEEIPVTTGTHVCGNSHTAMSESAKR